MNTFKFRQPLTIALVAAASLLTGCVTPPPAPISATPDTWTETNTMVIGVSIEEMPEPNVSFPGAGCLLCIAAAETAHADLSKQVGTFSTDPMDVLPEQIVALIESHGAKAVLIEEMIEEGDLPALKSEDPKALRRDYSAIAAEHGITHLLDLDVHYLGLRRHYSAYVPTSDPVAVLTGRTRLMDLNNQVYEVYQPFEVVVAADGEWKEPPTFPGLTNAYYQMLEESKVRFADTLKAQALPAEEDVIEDELAATDTQSPGTDDGSSVQ